MSFTDYLFIPLFFMCTIVYYILPVGKRWIYLLIVSVLFLCTWGIELLPIALFVTLLVWWAALAMDKRYEKQDQKINIVSKKEKLVLQNKTKKSNRNILWWTATVILLVLVYVKAQRALVGAPWGEPVVRSFSGIYAGWTSLLSKIPGVNWFVKDTAAVNRSGYSFFVPLGISYYVMSLIGYMADVYWRKERAEKNYAKLLLFVLYFPKLLEGPISKHKDIAEQLNAGHPFDYQKYCYGCQRIVWGYFKKLVIADRLNIFVTTVFGGYENHYGSEFLVAAIFGAFQLYCDFSGCMDIVLGASETLGISLEENFRRPFFSQSAAEFWRRWHITLGIWFKDYIYMPLVISPKLIKVSGKLRKRFGKRAGNAFITIIPLAAVWLLTGLWHGTGWDYIVWGIYWGLLIIFSTVFEPELKALTMRLRINADSKGYRLFRQVRTFFLFVAARIITIPHDLEVSRIIFCNIFGNFAPWKLVDGSVYNLGLDRPNFNLALLALLLLGIVSTKQEQGVGIRQRIDTLPIVPRWILWLGAIFFVLIFGVYGPGYDANSFVYMNY